LYKWHEKFIPILVDKMSDPSLESTVAQKSLKDLQFIELLPNADVQNNFVWHWAVLVSRVVTKYLPPFKAFKENVVFHIPHKYSKEMATKSETVSASFRDCLTKPLPSLYCLEIGIH